MPQHVCEELCPGDAKQLVQDRTVGQGPRQSGNPVGMGLKCGSSKTQVLPGLWHYTAVQPNTHRPLLSAPHVPGRALDTEVAAANEISLCLQEAGIPVGEVAINSTTRDVRRENGQLTRHVEHAERGLPGDGTVTVQLRDLNEFSCRVRVVGRTEAGQQWG